MSNKPREMDLQITTRRWTIRITRRKPAITPAVSAPSNAQYPMRTTAGFTTPRRATKDIR